MFTPVAISVARRSFTRANPAVCRNLVSSVLLTRTWDNESVAELKRQAKTRGLSPKGNKATLIQNIQQHDRSKANEFSPVPDPVRPMSTSSTTPAQGVAPGIPSVTQALPNLRQDFMVIIPDIPHADPESSVQVPYLPDFWDSSVSTGETQAEESLPKVLVVAGADTHPGGGPSHNHLDPTLDENVSNSTTARNLTEQGKIWDDVIEDLGLPPLKDIKAGFSKLF